MSMENLTIHVARLYMALCDMVTKQSLMNFTPLSRTNIDVKLWVKTLLWKGQLTDRFRLIVRHGIFVYD